MAEPLLAPFAALAAGAVAARFVSFSSRELLLAIAALAALALLGYCRSPRRVPAIAACLTALFFAGALVAVAHRPGPPPELDAEAREVVILAGCVVEPPVLAAEREQFVLELGTGARANVGLYLRPGERAPALRYGQAVELDARVRRSRNFLNPGSFDYAGYLARRDIYWSASGRASSLKIAGEGCGTRFWQAIYGLRTAALRRIEELYRGDRYKATMLQAVLIGESSQLEKAWTEDFRRTGTFHALVISGTHVSVLAVVLLFLLQVARCPQMPALMLTSLAGWLYALVSGWQAPVIRAAAGFTLYAAARYFYRRTRLLNLLAAVALGFVVLDPEQLFDASFLLSFLSVAALGALAVPLLERTTAPLARGLAGLSEVDRDPHLDPRVAHFRLEVRLVAETLRLWTGIPQRFWTAALAVALHAALYAWALMVTSALVQFGLALPMAAYFHRLSITGLTANVLIVPLMSIVVILGFAALLTGWSLFAAPAGWCLTFSQMVAGWHVRWEPEWRIPDPPLALAAAFLIALLAVPLARRGRPVAVAAALALLGVIVWHPFPPQREAGILELTAIDVGQGESLLVSFPDGKLLILDGGGFPAIGRHKPRLDIGEDVVSPYLWWRSVSRLDAVALSHGHEDHIGGLAALIDNFRPRELWVGAVPETADWRRVREHALRRGTRIVSLRAGRQFRYGGAEIQVLSPPPDYQPGPKPQNNDSLVLRLAYGRHSFLLTGDAERPVEARLLAGGLLSHADVLKVPHHGSRTSTTPPFLERVHPAFALISAGFENSFNNPHPDVVGRLERQGAQVLRTDLYGLVSVSTDGRGFRLQTMRWSR